MRLRVLRHPPDDGAANMAVDEALLESAIEHAGRLTLRVYRFARPTMTIGYAQEIEAACRLEACDDAGVPVVRRPTGGRALLHEHETTYSVTGPRLAASPRDVYERVSGAIQQGLERLGVPIDRATPTAAPAAAAGLPCLAAPTGHEIASGGRKLVPSAMRLRRDGFLLHGSLLWRVDEAHWHRLTYLPPDRELPAVGLEELGIGPVDEDRLEVSLAKSLQDTFAATRDVDGITEAEAGRALDLCAKYRSEAWNRRRDGSASAHPPHRAPMV